MAERSKALSSGFFVNLAVRKGVGSNPTLVKHFFLLLFMVDFHFKVVPLIFIESKCGLLKKKKLLEKKVDNL